MGFIENVILRHPTRGMDILRPSLDPNFCSRAARYIESWKKGIVFIITGFYVAGFAETDGPAGSLILAKALRKAGYTPVFVTDKLCKGYFEPENFPVEYMDVTDGEEYCADLLEAYHPSGLISIERCGRNSEGNYCNMRNVSLNEFTPAIDQLYEMARSRKIPTVAIGDGGNEIGMGNLKQEISEKLSLKPCVVETDELIIATVSNWGAYGLASLLAPLPDYSELREFYRRTVAMGSIDGVNKTHTLTADGFDESIEKEIYEDLKKFSNIHN